MIITNIKTLPYLQCCSGFLNGKWLVNWVEEWKPKRKTPNIKQLTYQGFDLSENGKFTIIRQIKKARKAHWRNPNNIGVGIGFFGVLILILFLLIKIEDYCEKHFCEKRRENLKIIIFTSIVLIVFTIVGYVVLITTVMK